MEDNNLDGGGLLDDGTYESTVARQRILSDRVVWEESYSFRNQPYRHLHHQKGLIGTVRVRLLEARSLQRSYWSALALGPVKHFGLSKAHGPVSSYCSFCLEYFPTDYEYGDRTSSRSNSNNSNSNSNNKNKSGAERWNPSGSSSSSSGTTTPTSAAGASAAKPKAPPDSMGTAGAGGGGVTTGTPGAGGGGVSGSAWKKSPVIASNDNPVWDQCHLEFPFGKGSMPTDGMRIRLTVAVYEDSTAVETILPGAGEETRALGTGSVDITSLCFGEDVTTGQTLPGLLDAWIPISLPSASSSHVNGSMSSTVSVYSSQQSSSSMMSLERYDPNDPLAPPSTTTTTTVENPHEHPSDNNNNNNSSAKSLGITGRVRVLVSYEPHGMEPNKHDIVALECFARRHYLSASCRPPALFPPLQPLQVIDRRGPYLLLATLPASARNRPNSRRRHGGRRSSSNAAPLCIRLHRNAVFVVERHTVMDAAHNWVLLPTDIFLSTPIGHAVEELALPLLIASKEMFLPAFLSLKLVWMALRTTTLASISGVQALSQTMWQEGAHSLLHNHDNDNNNNNNNPQQRHSSTRRSDSSSSASTNSSGIKLVQL